MSGNIPSELQPLLAQFSGEGTMLSCYADLSVTEGFRRDWRGPLQSAADALWKAVGEDGRARYELEQNLAAVRASLDGVAADTHWVAVFSAAHRGFLKSVPLSVPVNTELVLDRSPYLVPLLGAIHRRREYLAVHTDTHRGRIYAATPASVRLLAEFDEDVPKHQHSAGERYGYGQATIARHREDAILRYHKQLVRELERVWDTGQFSGLALLGEHEVLEHVKSALPPRIAGRIVRERSEAWDVGPTAVEDRVRSLASELLAEQEEAVAPDFWNLLREGKTVMGPRHVFEAAQSGLIGPNGHGYLVFGPDPRETVGRCVACRTLAPDPLGRCPKCQAPCAPGNLWEELLLTALQHGITARYVADPRKLEPYGGVVAVLPKPARQGNLE